MNSSNVTPLLFEGEHLVRVIDQNGEPWFVGNDVCRCLGLKNPRTSLALLDEDEKGVHSIDTLGGLQEVIVVSEAGVYRLVFGSRRPEAECFKRWLAHDVIPAIRKNGFYGKAANEEILSPMAAEKRPFPDWPMEELRTKKGVVDMYRLLYGTMAAQWMGPQLGFPSPPLELVEHGRQLTLTLTVPQAQAA